MTIDPLAWIALALTIGVTILVAVVILVANEVAVYRRSRRGGVVDLTGISAYGYRRGMTREPWFPASSGKEIANKLTSDGSIEIQVVGAIRLALEGAADDRAALTLTRWLVDQAPETKASDTDSTRLLLDGIRACGFSVSTESPSGAYAREQ